MAIHKTEPRFIAMRKFPVDYEEKILELLAQIENECAAEDYDYPEDMQAEAERMNSLAKVADGLSEFRGKHVEQANDLHNRLLVAASELHERATELEDAEPDYDDEGFRSAGFDIAALFSDL